MRVLIVEDELIGSKVLQGFLSPYGDCDIAVDGKEAIDAFRLAWEENKPYDLICMDIMMPNIDGQQALKKIREIEKERGVLDEVKVIMTTALSDRENTVKAFYEGGASSYIVKPVDKRTLLEEIRYLGLIR